MMSGGLRHRVSKLRNVKHGTNLGALGLPDNVGMEGYSGRPVEVQANYR
jgi:FPC/CPF motif-containing protein YcgG